MDLLIVLCAVACILYFAGIFVYAGPGSTFAWFWLFLGLLLLVWFLYRRGVKHKIIHFLFPLWIKVSILTTLILGAAVFVLAEILICSSMLSRPSPGLDYIVVLGAQVRGEQVSNSLKKRLDTALEYLLENEETVAVVSGGQGPGEDITEAEAMRRYLMEHGIEKTRIIKEAFSTSTQENLNFSKAYILLNWSGKTKEEGVMPKVGIVTNNFHVYRAVAVAEKLNFNNVEGIPAPSDNFLLVNQMVREFFALVKEKIVGNI